MKYVLIIEKSKGKFWGRIYIKQNLIVTEATSIEILERKMKKVLKDFHHIKDPAFRHSYDLTVFFEKYNFLKQSKIAELTGMNPGLLRQYASGVKHPSPGQAQKIEDAVHTLATELRSVSLYTEGKKL
jgi:hypothetical protein